MPVIYKITSPLNKIYIGQSWNWIKRISVYRRLACPRQLYLFNSLTKYGYENHKLEIILNLSDIITQKDLDDKEIYWWKYYKDLGFTMLNIKDPGKGGKMSEESKLKMSISLKGRIISLESRRKHSNTLKGRKLSLETINKIKKTRLENKGYIVSDTQKQKLREVNLGKILSEETKSKISSSLKGHITSEETRVKIGNKNRGSNSGLFGRTGELNPQSKKVFDLNNNTIFVSVKAASDCYKCNTQSLINKLNGRTKNNTTLKYLIDVYN